MSPLDRLFSELGNLPPEERHNVMLLRRVHELGDVTDPPAQPQPAWVAAAVAGGIRDVSRFWCQSPLFGAVRTLERLGVVKPEHDDTYVLAMVSCLGDRWDGEARTAALRADPGLRELVWRVFEVEGGGEVSLANVDKFSRPEATWAQTFRDLVADRTLPRGRVLESCLRALGRDFSAYRAGWFARLYRDLGPSETERTTHQPLLLRLLRSAVPATVSFAVAQLAEVAKAGSLDDEEFVAHCAPAMEAQAKSAAVAAVNLASAVAKRRPDLAPSVADAVGGALGHAHRDVQAKALAVLRLLDARRMVAARLDELEPSVRRDASRWLGIADARDEKGETDETDASAGLVAVTAPHHDHDLTAAELGARLLSGHVGAVEVERFLAALAAGDCGVEVLRKQAGKILADPRWQRSARRGLAALIAGAPQEPGIDTFLHRRLAEIAGSANRIQLLATPTDPAGWLDPEVFVARLAANPEPPRFDLIAALLRLAPEGRAGALRKAHALPGEPGAVARYVLGGETGAEAGEMATRAWWVAAARSRAPLEDDPHLIAAGLDGAGQGRAASYALRLEQREHRYEERGKQRVRVYYRPSVEVSPPGARERPDQPALAGPWNHRHRDNVWWRLEPDWIAWHASIWPHDAEPFLAVRVDELLTASEAYPVVTYGTTAILEALMTHPGRLGPMASATLAAGLSATEVQHRVLASDAFARLVPGRISPADVAEAMALLAGHCTATRWAATLRDAARAGATAAVIDVLDLLLPRLGTDHPGLHALLGTRHEEAVRTGHRTVGAPLRTWLKGVTGSSKAARTAKLILEEAGG